MLKHQVHFLLDAKATQYENNQNQLEKLEAGPYLVLLGLTESYLVLLSLT